MNFFAEFYVFLDVYNVLKLSPVLQELAAFYFCGVVKKMPFVVEG